MVFGISTLVTILLLHSLIEVIMYVHKFEHIYICISLGLQNMRACV